MFKIFLILISIFLYGTANSNIVERCDNTEHLNKLCKAEVVENLSYSGIEVSYTYNIDNEGKAFLHKKLVKNPDGTQAEEIIDSTTSDKSFTKTFKFDLSSKLIRKSVTGSDIETRITKYEHGTIDGNYAVKTINPLNQIVTDVYNNDGNLIKHVDINGLKTTYEYDTVTKKLIKEVKPNNIITTFIYSTDDLISNATEKVIQFTENQPKVIKFFKQDKTLIATHKEGFDGRYIVTDHTGDYLQHFKGEEKYTAPISNNQTNVASNLQYKYNVLGLKTEVIDTQASKTTKYKYDLLDRVVEEEIVKNGNKEIIYYVYDRANYGQGKISYIKSNSYKKEFFYNELSQIKATKEYLGKKIFVNQFFYTPDGKLYKTVTPNGLEVINDYNQYGYLSGVKTPKTNMAEFDASYVLNLLTTNLKDRLKLYKEQLNLKNKVTIYGYKKDIYTTLSNTHSDANVKEKLDEIVSLLDKTIILLNESIAEYQKAIDSYDKIIDNHLVDQLVQHGTEEIFKELYTVFGEMKREYLALSTNYLDMANSLLEEIIISPAILNNQFSHHEKLIGYYKDISQNTIDEKITQYNDKSETYSKEYFKIKNGTESNAVSIYEGMFDDPEYKYFYKVLEQNALGKVIKSIHGNGVVTSNEYDLETTNITRVTIGYYGQNDIKDLRYNYDNKGNLDGIYDLKKSFTQRFHYDDENKLIRAMNMGEDYYTNIVYSFDSADQKKKYILNETTQEFEKYKLKEDTGTFDIAENISVNVNNLYLVKNDSNEVKSSYSPDRNSYEKTLTASDNKNSGIYYKVDKTFKYNIENNQAVYKNFIFANDILVAINMQSEIEHITTPVNYYVHNDIDGSLDILTGELADEKQKNYYRPYGELTDKSWKNLVNVNGITTIGYKGFEHDLNLQLIDMNSYVYDPEIGILVTKEYINSSLPNKQMNQTIQALDTDSSKIKISIDAPDNNDMIWYQPNSSDGGLNILINRGTGWESIGAIGVLSQDSQVTLNSIDELNKIACFEGDKGFVASGSNKIAYSCNNSQEWKLGGSFVGTFSITDLTTTYFNALNGTTITAVAANNEFSGEKTFTKNGNFWIDSSSNFYVTNSLNSILAKSDFKVGDKAFFPINNSYQSLTRYNLETLGNKWVYNPLLGNISSSNSEIINAVTKTDITAMYNALEPVTLVDSKLYIKQLDSNNSPIYKRSDGAYITKSGYIIPTSYLDKSNTISLPPAYSASTVTFDSEKRIILANRTQATDWADAPDSVAISIPSINKTYTHIVNGSLDFWTDNTATDGQVNATEIFTKGSRSNLPKVTHSLTVLTKEVGSEPNYTTTGVVSSIDSNFKQWYYSLSGTIVNNLIDNPCLSLDNSDSYTNWTADFPNARCTREVNNSYSGTPLLKSSSGYLCRSNQKGGYRGNCSRSNIWTASVGGGWYASVGRCNDGDHVYTTSWSCTVPGQYTCPNGGTISGSICSKIDTEIKLFSSF